MKDAPYAVACQFCHIRDANMQRNRKRGGEGALRFGNTYADDKCVRGLGLDEFYDAMGPTKDEPPPKPQ